MLLDIVRPLDPVDREASSCLGLVCGEDVAAMENIPPKPISAVDGYALAQAAGEPPHYYRVKGVLRAGEESVRIDAGCACRVLTGAVLPENAWRVVPDEDVLLRDGELVIESFPKKKFIRPAGSLIAHGSLVAEKGKVLVPACISALSSLNIMNIKAHPRPKVFIIATGDELAKPFVEHGNRPVASNLALVGALACRFGARIKGTGIGPDDLDGLARMISYTGADMILTTGGTAGSEKDLTLQAAKRAGFEPVFSGLTMRPGSGCFAAVRDGVPLIGVPGPPPAVMSCFIALAVPVLNRLKAVPDAAAAYAVLKGGYKTSSDHEQLLPCVLGQEGAVLVAHNVKMGAMDAVSSMIKSNALAFVPAGRPYEDQEPVEIISCQPLTMSS